MAGSKENPLYTVYLVEKKHKYNLTPTVVSIDLSHQDKQLAQCATINMYNVRTATGKSICQLMNVRKRIFIYADDGEKKAEVFRGWVWTDYHTSDMESSIIQIKCYDNLIYLQESDDSFYFSKGKSTKSVMNTICDRWGINLKYSYSSITHSKLVLKGTLSNIITADVLELVRKRTGKKFVIYSQKDVMYIAPVGSNKKIYHLLKKNNTVEVRWETTMDGMTTKVKILGNADKGSEKVPVLATVKGDTKKYGTLQKLQTKGSDESLSAAKKEAKATIKEDGTPKVEYLVQSTDIPWIKKGDTVYVDAGHITGKNLIVKGIDRDISNKKKTMTLTLVNP